jgi:CBS domain-containing protein
MTRWTVADVMTPSTVHARVNTPFKALAQLIIGTRSGAVPVLDDESRLAGVVTETDLLRKEEYQDDPSAHRAPRWRHQDARERAAGMIAQDVMSSPALTVTAGTTIVEAARLLDRNEVHHLVVLDGQGRLAGLVTPHDLLKVYLRTDAELRDQVMREVITGYLGTNPTVITVQVADGRVTLRGEVENRSMIPLAVRLIGDLDGVVDVTSLLSYVIDDTKPPRTVLDGPAQPPRQWP